MRVLVTGATGFLGGCVSRALLDAGHAVLGLCRSAPERAETAEPGLSWCKGDIGCAAFVRAAAARVDAIVHCAGAVSLSALDRAQLFQVNVNGTRNVLEAAAARSLRVLVTSSSCAFGPTPGPRELDERAAAAPLDFSCPYVESKRAADELALAYAARGVDVVSLYPGVTLGPGDPGFGSTQLIRRYLRGELRFYLLGGACYCDARDVASAYVAALTRARSGGRYILGGSNRSHRELFDELQRVTGLHRCAPVPTLLAGWFALWSRASAAFVNHPYRDFDPAVVRWGALYNFCSSERAEEELGFRSRPLRETLRDTVRDHLRRKVAHPRTTALRELLVESAALPA